MKLIVGLGNPGQAYANNRHNIGFLCLRHFARAHGIHFDKKQAYARIGTGTIADNDIVLARPQTFMNESGRSVSRLVKKYAVDLNDLLVIHDDLDLPLGKIRLRHGSGPGGHNGVESIILELASQQFPRLRVGIGRPTSWQETIEANDTDVIHHVLSDFTTEEIRAITMVIPTVSKALLCFLSEGLTAAMNIYN